MRSGSEMEVLALNQLPTGSEGTKALTIKEQQQVQYDDPWRETSKEDVEMDQQTVSKRFLNSHKISVCLLQQGGGLKVDTLQIRTLISQAGSKLTLQNYSEPISQVNDPFYIHRRHPDFHMWSSSAVYPHLTGFFDFICQEQLLIGFVNLITMQKKQLYLCCAQGYDLLEDHTRQKVAIKQGLQIQYFCIQITGIGDVQSGGIERRVYIAEVIQIQLIQYHVISPNHRAQCRKQTHRQKRARSCRLHLQTSPQHLLKFDLVDSEANTVPSLNPTFLTQSGVAIKLSPRTIYLARVYFDEVLNFYLILPTEDPVLLAVVCMSLAINFNEPRKVSEIFTLQRLLEESGCEVSSVQLCSLLEAVTTALDFNLLYTTPYDYFPIFFHCFPWYPQLEEAFNMVLNLVIALPEACEYTAEQIFYGSVLAIFAYKGVSISQIQSHILQSLTDCWQKAYLLRDRILFELNQPEDQQQPQQ